MNKINKESVIDFFNKLAPSWDAGMIKDDFIIKTILDNAEVKENNEVLDVACGTGVLIPYYKERKVKSITGIDISQNMIDIAKSKFDFVSFICDDAETYVFDKKFDNIVIYNAFPHFSSPSILISHLSSFLNEGGTLTIAHGMSKEKLNNHHSGVSMDVSTPLMDEKKLANIFEKYLKVTCIISNENMYQVVGKKVK